MTMEIQEVAKIAGAVLSYISLICVKQHLESSNCYSFLSKNIIPFIEIVAKICNRINVYMF